MRLLLIAVLALLPVTAQAENVSKDLATTATPSDHVDAAESQGDEEVVDQSWAHGNPYSPTSPTNFDPFSAPLVFSPDVHDRSRLSMHAYESGPMNSAYGHFGNPLFPDSINSRGMTDHPFAMDSSTNLYGRDWRGGGR